MPLPLPPKPLAGIFYLLFNTIYKAGFVELVLPCGFLQTREYYSYFSPLGGRRFAQDTGYPCYPVFLFAGMGGNLALGAVVIDRTDYPVLYPSTPNLQGKQCGCCKLA